MYSYIFKRDDEARRGRRAAGQGRDSSTVQRLLQTQSVALEQLLISIDCEDNNWRVQLRDGLDEIKMSGDRHNGSESPDSDVSGTSE